MKSTLSKLSLLIILASSVLSGAAQAQAGGSIAGRTLRSWEPAHGAQIEYMRPNGRAYLWYPGNRVVVPSFWRAEAIRGLASICFLYPLRSYNPVTRQLGGRWECRPERVWARHVVEVARGDIFGLSRRAATPFPLPREPLSFSELRQVTRRAR
jgi:hypothetical protein